MAEDPLLMHSLGERVDDSDILGVQRVVLLQAKEDEQLLSWPAAFCARVAREALPVGTEIFQEELEVMRNQLCSGKEDQLPRWMEKMARYKPDGDCSEEFQRVWKHVRWLPLWFSNLRVVDISLRMAATQHERGTKVHFTQNYVVGPAVRVAFWANFTLWSFYAFFPLLALAAGVAERHFHLDNLLWSYSSTGLVNYTTPMLLPFVTVVLWVMFQEVRTLVYVLPAQVAVSGPFLVRLPRIIHRTLPFCQGFWVQYVGVLGISLSAHLDLATNALFLSRTVATPSKNMRVIQGHWEAIWRDSLFFNHFIQFQTCVTLMYLLVFGQFLYSLSCSVPLRIHGGGGRTMPDFGRCSEVSMRARRQRLLQGVGP